MLAHAQGTRKCMLMKKGVLCSAPSCCQRRTQCLSTACGWVASALLIHNCCMPAPALPQVSSQPATVASPSRAPLSSLPGPPTGLRAAQPEMLCCLTHIWAESAAAQLQHHCRIHPYAGTLKLQSVVSCRMLQPCLFACNCFWLGCAPLHAML